MNRFKTVAVLALTLALLTGCQQSEEEATPIRPVLTLKLEPTILAGSRFAGTVQPKIQAQLGARASGRLVARNVGIGDLVKKDELLATLDSTTYELAVRSAKAELSSAEATYASAVDTEQRQRALLESNTSAQATVESAEQARESAFASLIRARTSLAKAEEQLSYTRITAEFDGVVTATGAEVGQVVSSGEAIITVARPDERDAVVDIPETATGISIGSQFTVALQVTPQVKVAGTVREVAPAADPTTRSRRVKIALDNPPGTFRLGTTITAELDRPKTTALLLPASAMVEKDGKTAVWVADPGKGEVHLRDIETSAAGHNLVLVQSGLAAGDLVVTAGVHSLEEGQKVRVQDGEPK